MIKWWGDIYQGYLDIEREISKAEQLGASPDELEEFNYYRRDYINRYRSLIGRNLFSIRDSLGISYRDLAKKSSVSSATILRYEKGTVFPKYETLESLIKVFQELGLSVKFSDLLKDDYQMSEQYEDILLSPKERQILESVSKLNAKGQEVASERVEELTKISDYTEKDV